MAAAAPSMDPAAATPKSSLEIMLDAIRERDEQRQDNHGEPFLPPSPARPRGRGRPPSSTRWPLPAGFKVCNGEGTAASTLPAVEKKPCVGNNSAIISDVIRLAIEPVVDDAASLDSEEQGIVIGPQGSGLVADPTLSPHHGTDKLIREDMDGTAIWISNHGAVGIVGCADKQQDSESEINVEDETSLHDATVAAPGGDDATDACIISSAARAGRRAPRQQSRRSVSPPRSSSGSSGGSEPEKWAKAGVGKLLWGSTGCVRAPMAAVARMVLNSCGSTSSGVRAPEERYTDQGAGTGLSAVKSPDVASGGGDTDVSTVKTTSATTSSVSRSGVGWRWLKKISCRLGNATDVGETAKAGLRQRKSRSSRAPAEGS